MGTYGLNEEEIADVFEDLEFESHCEGDFWEETFIKGAKVYIDRLRKRGAYIYSEKKKLRVTPKQLHDLYLEATKKLDPKNFNAKAQKPYKDLTEEQKFIDKFIAEKINKINSYYI